MKIFKENLKIIILIVFVLNFFNTSLKSEEEKMDVIEQQILIISQDL